MPRTKTTVKKQQIKRTPTPEVNKVEDIEQLEGAEQPSVQPVEKPLGRRTPLRKQKATGVKSRPGYRNRQVVEKGGRLQRFLDAGYTIIPSDRLDNDGRIQTARSGGSVSREVVNWTNLNASDAATAVWMEIQEDYYNEDQEEKLAVAEQRQADIDPRNLAKLKPKEFYGAKFDQEFDGI